MQNPSMAVMKSSQILETVGYFPTSLRHSILVETTQISTHILSSCPNNIMRTEDGEGVLRPFNVSKALHSAGHYSILNKLFLKKIFLEREPWLVWPSGLSTGQ